MAEVLNIRTTPCSYCGRNFSDEALMRHEKICSKTSQKTKKYVYDSAKVRSIEPEVPSFGNKSFQRHNGASKREQPIVSKKSNWRQQHEDLVRSLRAAREVSHAMKTGKPLPPPAPPSINPDYIQCDYCGRRFNETAAARHIEFCKNQHERIPKGKANSLAAQKQANRINYKPPSLKPRKPTNDFGGYRTKPPTEAYKGNYSVHDEQGYGQGKPYKNNPTLQSRSNLSSKGGLSKQQLSQSSSFLETSGSRNNSGDSRVVGRGRASTNRPQARYNDTSPVGRLPHSSSHNSHMNDAKFCTECGFKYPSSTCKFCSKCGTPKVF